MRSRGYARGGATIDTYHLTKGQNIHAGDYQQLLYWSITAKPSRVVILQLLALPLFIVMGYIFSVLAVDIGKMPAVRTISALQAGVAIAGILVTLILHELAHGLAMQMFGARPKYGALWKQLMFYATAPGYGFQRNSYILVALAPVLLLSCLGILAMFLLQGTAWVGMIVLCAAYNVAGAAGDLWMAHIVSRYSSSVYVVDERDGIRILMPT